MIKALKVTMAIWGAVGVVAGLAYIIVPSQVTDLYSFGQIADNVRWIMAFSGAVFISAGSWIIVGARDPIRYINWLKFEITKTLLVVAVTAYAMIQGYVSFSQVGMIFILFAVFAVALLALYPWRVKESTQM